MAIVDVRTPASNRKGKHATSGRMVVLYRGVTGRTTEALVLGAGSTSGLKLQLRYERNRIVDNVAKATTSKQTNVYFSRRAV